MRNCAPRTVAKSTRGRSTAGRDSKNATCSRLDATSGSRQARLIARRVGSVGATVRSAGTMSPPAKTPGAPVIIEEDTTTVPSGARATPGTERRKAVSLSWPSARIRLSAGRVSRRPVGCGTPASSSSIASTTSSWPSKALMVRSQLIVTPSASASAASSAWAGICARVRR
ncbi:MAG TPA: hypothetical protein VKV23_07050 [Acidimicrobiales bacterium]|nr:hypothetical protein [Acidimicrobiales bacterium]